ncbi:MAG: arabinofuranosidase catalytic domain-containing protein [Flavipsychrobacter sp.]
MITTFYKISVPPPLDIIGGAAVAVGVRKLYSGYMGKCMRIRRSSDNAEQDIGFNGLDLNVAAFSAFVGAGTGYITTLYDQSGNGHNATQTTAANQPILVLNVQNGKPVIQFVAASSTFLTFGTVLGKPANYTILCAYSVTNLINPMFVYGSGDSTGSSYQQWGGSYINHFGANGYPNWIHSTGTAYSYDYQNIVFVANKMVLISDSYTSGVRTDEFRGNGVVCSPVDTNGIATANSGIAYNYSIGRIGDFNAKYFDGYFTDFVQYASKLTDAQQAKLENSFNDYYAIY